MKLLSLILFCLALIWTWRVVHQQSPVPFETHAAIQSRIADLIQESIKTQRPEATAVTVEKVWTEVTDQQKLKAHFVYSFVETSSTGAPILSRLKGEGLLKRDEKSSEDTDRWILSEIRTNQDLVEFREDLVITPETSTSLAPSPTGSASSHDEPAVEAPSSH